MCPAVHSLTRQDTLENEICMCNSWPSKEIAAIPWVGSEWNSFAVMDWYTEPFELILTMILQARSSAPYPRTSRLRTRS